MDACSQLNDGACDSTPALDLRAPYVHNGKDTRRRAWRRREVRGFGLMRSPLDSHCACTGVQQVLDSYNLLMRMHSAVGGGLQDQCQPMQVLRCVICCLGAP